MCKPFLAIAFLAFAFSNVVGAELDVSLSFDVEPKIALLGQPLRFSMTFKNHTDRKVPFPEIAIWEAPNDIAKETPRYRVFIDGERTSCVPSWRPQRSGANEGDYEPEFLEPKQSLLFWFTYWPDFEEPRDKLFWVAGKHKLQLKMPGTKTVPAVVSNTIDIEIRKPPAKEQEITEKLKIWRGPGFSSSEMESLADRIVLVSEWRKKYRNSAYDADLRFLLAERTCTIASSLQTSHEEAMPLIHDAINLFFEIAPKDHRRRFDLVVEFEKNLSTQRQDGWTKAEAQRLRAELLEHPVVLPEDLWDRRVLDRCISSLRMLNRTEEQ